MSDIPALVARLEAELERGAVVITTAEIAALVTDRERLEKERDEARAVGNLIGKMNEVAEAQLEAAEKRCNAREGALIKIVNLSSFHDELETARVIANAALAEGEQP